MHPASEEERPELLRGKGLEGEVEGELVQASLPPKAREPDAAAPIQGRLHHAADHVAQGVAPELLIAVLRKRRAHDLRNGAPFGAGEIEALENGVEALSCPRPAGKGKDARRLRRLPRCPTGCPFVVVGKLPEALARRSSPIRLLDKGGEACDLEGAPHVPAKLPRLERTCLACIGLDQGTRPLGKQVELDGPGRGRGDSLQVPPQAVFVHRRDTGRRFVDNGFQATLRRVEDVGKRRGLCLVDGTPDEIAAVFRPRDRYIEQADILGELLALRRPSGFLPDGLQGHVEPPAVRLVVEAVDIPARAGGPPVEGAEDDGVFEPLALVDRNDLHGVGVAFEPKLMLLPPRGLFVPIGLPATG